MRIETTKEILQFWFGENYKIWPEQAISKKWFMSGRSFDQAISEQFSRVIEQLLNEDFELPSNVEELLALIISLDQFTRNIFRGTAAAFSGDNKALKLALFAVESKLYLKLPAHQRIFVLMPFEHAESLQHQQTCIRLFDEMIIEHDETVLSKIKDFKQHAVEHYNIIKQFGRFPHRNKILGRKSTSDEEEYIIVGKTFGQ